MADFEKKILTFQDAAAHRDVHVSFDLCIGADGCYSTVRRQLMRVTRWVHLCSRTRILKPIRSIRMNYQQEYIPHDYIELRVPARVDSNGEKHFQLDPGHLHIWPRHSFMLIALPNRVSFCNRDSHRPHFPLIRTKASLRHSLPRLLNSRNSRARQNLSHGSRCTSPMRWRSWEQIASLRTLRKIPAVR
jgi:kynurenine 3-monooxygenase